MQQLDEKVSYNKTPKVPETILPNDYMKTVIIWPKDHFPIENCTSKEFIAMSDEQKLL